MNCPTIGVELDSANQTIEVTFLHASITEDEQGNLLAGAAFDIEKSQELLKVLGEAIEELKELR